MGADENAERTIELMVEKLVNMSARKGLEAARIAAGRAVNAENGIETAVTMKLTICREAGAYEIYGEAKVAQTKTEKLDAIVDKLDPRQGTLQLTVVGMPPRLPADPPAADSPAAPAQADPPKPAGIPVPPEPYVPEQKAVTEAELRKACQVIKEARRASLSTLQRRMKINVIRAGVIMDALEERGIVGPAKGNGEAREILDVAVPM